MSVSTDVYRFAVVTGSADAPQFVSLHTSPAAALNAACVYERRNPGCWVDILPVPRPWNR